MWNTEAAWVVSFSIIIDNGAGTAEESSHTVASWSKRNKQPAV